MLVKPNHDRQQPVLRPHGELGLVVEHQRPVVGEGQGGDVADHDQRDLGVPDRRRPDHPVVDRAPRCAEQVGAAAERIGEERDECLALEDEQRQIMRCHVHERDRHERVGKGAREPSGREAAAHGSRSRDPEPVEAKDQPDGAQQPDRRGDLDRCAPGEPERLEEVGQARDDSRPQRSLGGAVEAHPPDHDREQGDRPGQTGVEAREP